MFDWKPARMSGFFCVFHYSARRSYCIAFPSLMPLYCAVFYSIVPRLFLVSYSIDIRFKSKNNRISIEYQSSINRISEGSSLTQEAGKGEPIDSPFTLQKIAGREVIRRRLRPAGACRPLGLQSLVEAAAPSRTPQPSALPSHAAS
jgi:hypothetical protein